MDETKGVRGGLRRTVRGRAAERVLRAGCGVALALSTAGLAAVLGAGSASAAGTTWFAAPAPSGSADCSSASPCSLASALADAGDGDTVDLAAGTYEVTALTIATSVTLQPTAPGSSVTLDDSSSGGDGSVLTVDAGVTAAVSGVTITGGFGTIPENAGTAAGGGINNNGTLTLTDSTISDNTAGEKASTGGGIYNDGTLTVTDSTISDNTASGFTAEGGGIFNDDGTLTVTDSTISDNTASGFSGDPSQGGGIYNQGGTVTVGATIIAGNTATTGGNCFDSGGGFTSAGYNLTDDSTGADCGFTTTTDVAGENPQLGALADNGGPTETMLPASNSPAAGVIPADTVVNGVPACGGGATDQRGVSRPAGDATACTIGAVEADAAPSAPAGVSATPGNGEATVTFTAPDDGGSPITGYTVTAANTTNPGASAVTATGTTSPIAVTGLTNGDTYTFMVTAANAVGTGPASAASNPVVPTAPAAIVSVVATGALSYSDSGAITSGRITISPATGAVTSAAGTITIPGAKGGTASITIRAVRILGFYIGDIQVTDPSEHLSTIAAILTTKLTHTATGQLTGTATGLVGLRAYTLNFTI